MGGLAQQPRLGNISSNGDKAAFALLIPDPLMLEPSALRVMMSQEPSALGMMMMKLLQKCASLY